MKRSLAGIAGIVAIATLISKIFGLLRATCVAAVFGVGAVADAYNYAYIIPGFLLVLLGGINGPLHSTLVSVLAKRDKSTAAALVETITTLVGFILLLITISLIVFADFFTHLIAPGLEPQVKTLAAQQLQIMAPIALLSGFIGIGFGTLNAAQHYWLPSISPMLSSVTVIIGLGFFVLQHGIPANTSDYPLLPTPYSLPPIFKLGGLVLAGGTLAGAVLQWVVQLIVQWREGMGTLRLRFDFYSPGVKEAIAVMTPAILSSSMTQINIYVDLFFASYIPHAASALNYAGLLAQTPKGIFTSALLIPFMTVFSQLTKPEDWLGLKLRIRQSIIITALTMLPLGALMITLAVPIVRIVYERQAFDSNASKLVATLVMAYGLGAFTSVVVSILVRVFYALEDGQTPFRITLINILLNIVLDYFLVKAFGAPGLVLASMGVNLTATIMLLWCLHRRLNGLALREWSLPILGLIGISGIAGLTCWLTSWGFEILWGSEGILRQLLQLSLASSIGLGVFAALVSVMKLPEVELLVNRLRGKRR
ncbi:murein biosynthesis integral membrane protein MurJ [Scytonema sp. UIC 10036]|uniref:murein biosynthesis integral membrane protein MurJ n=1 Tax=Scytonema sp. UIC 10036 TaxID=2304196 RepID=UPI0012DAA00A|nr:murein biosynthesis integral membrane protein MurJ [Scytonema sp. UIC 10036]MUG98457.1 murein biosynthesis integral membrane protein MurJ [Scytonema sp. UIC 10036]